MIIDLTPFHPTEPRNISRKDAKAAKFGEKLFPNNLSLRSELGVLCALAGTIPFLFDNFRFILPNHKYLHLRVTTLAARG